VALAAVVMARGALPKPTTRRAATGAAITEEVDLSAGQLAAKVVAGIAKDMAIWAAVTAPAAAVAVVAAVATVLERAALLGPAVAAKAQLAAAMVPRQVTAVAPPTAGAPLAPQVVIAMQTIRAVGQALLGAMVLRRLVATAAAAMVPRAVAVGAVGAPQPSLASQQSKQWEALQPRPVVERVVLGRRTVVGRQIVGAAKRTLEAAGRLRGFKPSLQ